MTTEKITNKFTAHQKSDIDIIRSKAIELSILIDYYCPDSREKSISLTKLEECVMWINKCLSKETIDEEKNSEETNQKTTMDFSLISGMIV